MTQDPSLAHSFADAERAQLRAWMRLSTADKIAFFEEMVDLAWRSGALAPDRLALRDRPPTHPAPGAEADPPAP